MNTKTVLIAAGIAAGAFLLLRSRAAAAGTHAKGGPVKGGKPGKAAQLAALAQSLGAGWNPAEWSVQTVRYTPGQAIGNYAGMTQEAANVAAQAAAANEFLSPWTVAYGVKK